MVQKSKKELRILKMGTFSHFEFHTLVNKWLFYNLA